MWLGAVSGGVPSLSVSGVQEAKVVQVVRVVYQFEGRRREGCCGGLAGAGDSVVKVQGGLVLAEHQGFYPSVEPEDV